MKPLIEDRETFCLYGIVLVHSGLPKDRVDFLINILRTDNKFYPELRSNKHLIFSYENHKNIIRRINLDIVDALVQMRENQVFDSLFQWDSLKKEKWHTIILNKIKKFFNELQSRNQKNR